MTMTQEQFDTLVKKLEDYAQRQPANYKLRLRLLAALGYTYIFLVLVGLVAVLTLLVLIVVYTNRVNALLIKLGILIAVPLFIILRSLWVHIPPPKGLELRRQQVPRLFDLVMDASDIPWHRVINAKGEISHSPLRRGGDYKQRLLLEQEGIKFSPEGKIKLQEYLWRPSICVDVASISNPNH